MFRRTEQGTEDTSTRDEHAYEDNWYRSLKALAEHRAAEEASEPEGSTDEPRGGPSEEGDPETAEPVDATGEPAASLEVTTDEDLEAHVEEAATPVEDLEARVEETAMPVEDLEARVVEPPMPAEELRARVEELGVPVEVSAQAPDVSEVEELSARTDQLIERLRTLRDADEVERSTGEAAAADTRQATSQEELGTRAQQLLERLRTLRTLGDAEEHRPRPEEHPSTGA